MATYNKTNHPGIKALDLPEKTCRRWQLTVSLGRKVDGSGYDKRRKTVKGTLTEARQAYIDFERELKQSGINPDLAALTFSTFADQWLEERKQSGSIAKGTTRKNEYHLNLMRPFVGNVEISAFSVDTLKRLLAKLRSEGGKNGKPLSGTTVHNAFATLKTMCEDATVRGAMQSNPCKKIKAPKADTKEKEALPQAEAERLAGLLVEGEPRANTIGFLLALTCGLRREEVCGLRWCDVAGRELRVNHAFTAEHHELTDPKNKTSRRTIPMDATTCDRLIEWKQVQADKLAAKGIKQTATTPVVSTRDAGHVHPENFGRSWRSYARNNGFDGYSLHQLRHTFATLLVAKGVDLVTASRLMGHSSTTMLEKVYAHLVQENLVNATAIIGSVLFGEAQNVSSFEDAKNGLKTA